MENYIIGFLIVLVIIFLKSYFQEKGKLRALQSENSKLVNQTEKIKAEYTKELEELKKEHQLEISKRKYKYEIKREQYLNFFNLIDSFNKENHNKIQPRLHTIISNFSSDYLSAEDQTSQMTAITNMTSEIQKFISEANEDIIKIKQQTNSIKLIASSKVLGKISDLELAFDIAMKDSNEMMENLSVYMSTDNQIGMQEDQITLQNSALAVKEITDELITLMRNELDEI